MGICNYSTHRDSAHLLSTLALQQALSRNDTFNAVMANLTLGQFHKMENNHTRWLNYVQAAVDLANRTRNHRLKLLANINLMDFSIASRDYHQAIQTGMIIKAMTSDMETEHLTDIYTDSLLYQAYLAIENYPSAIQHLNKYYSNILKTKEKEYLSELVILQNQQEIQEKNLSIAQQRLQIQQQKKRFIVLLLSSLFIIVLLSSYIFFKNIHRKYSRNIFHKDRTIDKLLEVSAPGLPLTHTLPLSLQQHQEDPALAETETERHTLYHEFIALMEKERLYLNPQLDQKTLVSILGTNKQYLYQAISQHEDANFKHILNRYRVNEAKKIMENFLINSKSFSFDSIYLDAGFNSITSYYRAFKLITGLTPGEYMTELQHEINEKRMPNNTASDH
jgi:YesN/AraC family two-component response regulator